MSWRKMRSCKISDSIHFCHIREGNLCCLLLSAVDSALAQHLLISSELWNLPLSILPSRTQSSPIHVDRYISALQKLFPSHMGKKAKDKNPYILRGISSKAICGRRICKRTATLGTVKSTWLWRKRRWDTGTVLDGFATFSGIQYIPQSLVKGVSHAGFSFYFLSFLECTLFCHPVHTTKCFGLSSFRSNLLTTLLTTRQEAPMTQLRDIYSKSWINPGPKKNPHLRMSLLILPLFGMEKRFTAGTETVQCVAWCYLLNAEYQIRCITPLQIRQITLQAHTHARKKILGSLFTSWMSKIITLKFFKKKSSLNLNPDREAITTERWPCGTGVLTKSALSSQTASLPHHQSLLEGLTE